MKSIIIWIALALLLIGLIGGATVVYNNYMKENNTGGVADINGMFQEGTKPPLNAESKTEESVADGEENLNSEERESDSIGESEEESGSDTVIESESKSETQTEEETTESQEDELYYPAPDFTVYTADGEAVKLSDFRGKTVVINFWASDCYYCVEEMPAFQQAYEKYGDDVVFMMVCHMGFSNSTVSREKRFIDSNGYTFNVYYDTTGEAVSQYYIRGIPNTYFVQSNGGLYQYYIPGATNYEALEDCILGAIQK